jgi:hypothetical protein
MNKITDTIIKYLNSGEVKIVHPTLNVELCPGEYRGTCPFQNEKVLESVNFIKDFLKFVTENGNCIDLRWKSESLKNICETFDLTENELKKNILVTLYRLGLISSRTNNWDYICVTEIGAEHIDDEIEIFEEFIRTRVRSLVFNDEKNKSSIIRIKDLIEIWGVIYWWEIWFCLRTDIDFETIKNDIKTIRKMFNLSKTKYIPSKLNEITRLFDEHNITKRLYPNLKLIRKKTTLDFVNLRAMISNSWGNRFAFFSLKPQGQGQDFTLQSLFERNTKKVKRTLKKDTSYLKSDTTFGLDCHHIIPHDYGHYNPELHSLIESIENGILITEKDHNKFPKKDNEFVKLEVIENQIIFKSYKDSKKCVVLEDVDHIDLKKFESRVCFNKKLVKKLFS